MKCIHVTLTSGKVVSVHVDDDVNELPQEDLQALEEWITFRKAEYLKQREELK